MKTFIEKNKILIFILFWACFIFIVTQLNESSNVPEESLDETFQRVDSGYYSDCTGGHPLDSSC